MKTNNKKLIKLLGTLDILESEEIKEDNLKTESDVTYTVSNVAGNESVEYRVLPDSVDDETVLLLLKAARHFLAGRSWRYVRRPEYVLIPERLLRL